MQTSGKGGAKKARSLRAESRDFKIETVRILDETEEELEKRLAKRAASHYERFRWLTTTIIVRKINLSLNKIDAVLHLRHVRYHFQTTCHFPCQP